MEAYGTNQFAERHSATTTWAPISLASNRERFHDQALERTADRWPNERTSERASERGGKALAAHAAASSPGDPSSTDQNPGHLSP